jgi:hypothetical protein
VYVRVEGMEEEEEHKRRKWVTKWEKEAMMRLSDSVMKICTYMSPCVCSGVACERTDSFA